MRGPLDQERMCSSWLPVPQTLPHGGGWAAAHHASARLLREAGPHSGPSSPFSRELFGYPEAEVLFTAPWPQCWPRQQSHRTDHVASSSQKRTSDRRQLTESCPGAGMQRGRLSHCLWAHAN